MSSHDRRRRQSSRERNRNNPLRRKKSFEAAALRDVKEESRSYSPFSLLRTQVQTKGREMSDRERNRKRRRSSSRQVFIKKEEIPETPFPANIGTALQEEERKLSYIDRDLRQLMRSADPDLDIIGKKTGDRKKVQRNLKRLKREGYRRESWVPRAASEVR